MEANAQGEHRRKELRNLIREKKKARLGRDAGAQSKADELKNQLLMETTDPALFETLKNAKKPDAYRAAMQTLQSSLLDEPGEHVLEQAACASDDEDLPPVATGPTSAPSGDVESGDDEALPPAA